MEGLTNKLTLAEIDQRITRSAVEAVIEIGYYLKQIRDRKLYLEAGCKDVYEYAEKQYGYSRSTTSRNMNRNDRFSVGGNSPELAEEYRLYSKSQLQEMLSLEGGQLKEVKPDMTVKQIREMKPKRKKAMSEEQDVAIENPVHRFKDDLEAYGWSWNETVKEYLKKGYESNENEREIEVLGKAVVVLKQDDITVFMGKGGPVLFEVENARLAKEFEFYSKQNPPVATSHRSEKCIHRPDYFCSLEDEGKLISGDGVNCIGKCCWNCPKHGHCKLECLSSAERPVLSALGFSKTVRPESSLITTPGCGDGKFDCSSCHRECDIRQEECYCIHAPMGNPYPCTIIEKGLESLEFAADGCQFLNPDLAEHRAGDREPVPCCEKCGGKDDCPSACDRVKKAIATSHKNLAAETQQKETERCENAAEPVGEEMYTPQYFLEEQKARLNEILALGEDEVKSLPRKMVERQKTIVAALAAMVCDLEEMKGLEKPEQPELPVFKNNDQRKAFIDSYMDWPIWIETKQTGERYYRYDLHDGVSFVVKVYYHECFDYGLPVGTKYEDRFKAGFGSEEYYLVMEEKFFKDCLVSKSTLIDYLKGVQKK